MQSYYVVRLESGIYIRLCCFVLPPLLLHYIKLYFCASFRQVYLVAVWERVIRNLVCGHWYIYIYICNISKDSTQLRSNQPHDHHYFQLRPYGAIWQRTQAILFSRTIHGGKLSPDIRRNLICVANFAVFHNWSGRLATPRGLHSLLFQDRTFIKKRITCNKWKRKRLWITCCLWLALLWHTYCTHWIKAIFESVCHRHRHLRVCPCFSVAGKSLPNPLMKLSVSFNILTICYLMYHRNAL